MTEGFCVEGLAALIWPEWVLRGLAVVAVWAVAWYLVRYLNEWIERLGRRNERFALETRDLRLLDQILDSVIVLAALILTVSLLKMESFLYGLLTAFGVVGIAVGFAAKDIVANMFSGLFLLMDRNFVVGDAVEIGAHAGTVQRISLRTTTVATWDGPVVTLPNSIVVASAVLNYSAAERRRIHLIFAFPVHHSLEQSADYKRAAAVLRQTAEAEPRVAREPAPMVVVGEIRDRSVELALICFTRPDDWFQTRSDLRQALLAAIHEAGLELAVPVLKNI